MESARGVGNDRRPGGDTRLRLVDLVTPRGQVELGGGLACVATEPAERADVASAIARAVIGPRTPDVRGTIEIAGQYVELHSLPAPLLRPSAPATVDAELFAELWAKTCAHQRAELEAAHAARRLERHRTDAAIERARRRLLRSDVPRAAVVAAVPEPVAEPEPIAIDEVTPQLEALLAAFDALTPVQDDDAFVLAAEFDALQRDVLVGATAPAPPREAELVAARARVEAAREALLATKDNATVASRADIDACHRELVEAERLLSEAARKERPQAAARYEAALAAERAALASAGVDSYAGFLMAIAVAGPAPVGDDTRSDAEAEFAAATADLERLQAAAAPPTPAVDSARVAERDLELRARAAQLLGRFPHEDPAGELRAIRREHPEAARLRAEMATVLAVIDVDAGPDVVGTARETVRERQAHPPVVARPAPLAAPAPAPEPFAPFAPPAPAVPAPSAEEEALLRERAAHDDALADLEAQLEAVDRLRTAPLDALDPDTAAIAFASLLDRYRAADLLAGRLPVVVDGVLDAMDAAAVAAVAMQLAAIHDVQVIAVTARPDVAHVLANVGAMSVRWGRAAAQVATAAPAPSSAPSVPAATTARSCAEHPAKPSSATCAHCGRASCVDCLVYVPGENDLWCMACAEGLRARNLKLLRRRGA